MDGGELAQTEDRQVHWRERRRSEEDCCRFEEQVTVLANRVAGSD